MRAEWPGNDENSREKLMMREMPPNNQNKNLPDLCGKFGFP